MRVSVKMVCSGYCEIAQHDLCVGARVIAYGSHKEAFICTCKCHETGITDETKKEKEKK